MKKGMILIAVAVLAAPVFAQQAASSTASQGYKNIDFASTYKANAAKAAENAAPPQKTQITKNAEGRPSIHYGGKEFVMIHSDTMDDRSYAKTTTNVFIEAGSDERKGRRITIQDDIYRNLEPGQTPQKMSETVAGPIGADIYDKPGSKSMSEGYSRGSEVYTYPDGYQQFNPARLQATHVRQVNDSTARTIEITGEDDSWSEKQAYKQLKEELKNIGKLKNVELEKGFYQDDTIDDNLGAGIH